MHMVNQQNHKTYLEYSTRLTETSMDKNKTSMDKDIFLFLSIDVFCSTCLEGKDYPLNPLDSWSIKTS